MARSMWKGHLELGRLTVAVKMFAATSDGRRIEFQRVHATCGTRVLQELQCPTCQRPVPSAELAKGYEVEKGRYVLITEAEIDAIAVESTHTIQIAQFSQDPVNPLLRDRSYYLAPDVALGGRHGFALLRKAIGGRVGIATYAAYGREYQVCLEVSGPALVMTTLKHPVDVRGLDAIEELQGMADEPVQRQELQLAKRLVEAYTAPLNLEAFTDRYQAQLAALVKAKVDGREYITAPAAARSSTAVALLDALTMSLEEATAPKRRRKKTAA